MIATLAALLLGTLGSGAPAAAAHGTAMGGPFASATACEARKTRLSLEDRDLLLDHYPQIFLSASEVTSFLDKALACERADGRWYLVDRRAEVLNSEWFQGRFR